MLTFSKTESTEEIKYVTDTYVAVVTFSSVDTVDVDVTDVYLPVLTQASLKRSSAFTTVGQTTPRKDGLEKVTGQAQYAADIRVPGMLYAKILRPPAHGAKL